MYGDHAQLKIWYNPCIIHQYINVHGKTDENHALFFKSETIFSTWRLTLLKNYTTIWTMSLIGLKIDVSFVLPNRLVVLITGNVDRQGIMLLF